MNGVKVLRWRQVVSMIGISRSSLYARISPTSPQYDHSFPSRVRIGSHSVGWLEHEIVAWIESHKD